MADLAVQNSSASVDVRAMAATIKAAQGPEISTMKGWLGQWGASQSSGPTGHGSGGMMTDQDMSSLESANGAEFNRMLLTMMIAHHRGAVTMAQDVLGTTENADVKDLATAVVGGQNTEIGTIAGNARPTECPPQVVAPTPAGCRWS